MTMRTVLDTMNGTEPSTITLDATSTFSVLAHTKNTDKKTKNESPNTTLSPTAPITRKKMIRLVDMPTTLQSLLPHASSNWIRPCLTNACKTEQIKTYRARRRHKLLQLQLEVVGNQTQDARIVTSRTKNMLFKVSWDALASAFISITNALSTQSKNGPRLSTIDGHLPDNTSSTAAITRREVAPLTNNNETEMSPLAKSLERVASTNLQSQNVKKSKFGQSCKVWFWQRRKKDNCHERQSRAFRRLCQKQRPHWMAQTQQRYHWRLWRPYLAGYGPPRMKMKRIEEIWRPGSLPNRLNRRKPASYVLHVS